jgi:antitoxin (DNA-binding transcriptional repressor) of toxin-antitoxin stability system
MSRVQARSSGVISTALALLAAAAVAQGIFEIQVRRSEMVARPSHRRLSTNGTLAYIAVHWGSPSMFNQSRLRQAPPAGEEGTMTRVSISEARRRLPQLVRQVKQDRGSVVQITVRDEVVAELRAALPRPEPGAAARALLELARNLPRPRRRGHPTDVSVHVKEYLYGQPALGARPA